jgi:hypothetical protein
LILSSTEVGKFRLLPWSSVGWHSVVAVPAASARKHRPNQRPTAYSSGEPPYSRLRLTRTCPAHFPLGPLFEPPLAPIIVSLPGYEELDSARTISIRNSFFSRSLERPCRMATSPTMKSSWRSVSCSGTCQSHIPLNRLMSAAVPVMPAMPVSLFLCRGFM